MTDASMKSHNVLIQEQYDIKRCVDGQTRRYLKEWSLFAPCKAIRYT